MTIQFKHDVPLEDTLIFESIYPENLQMDLDEKKELQDSGAEFIIMLNEETGEFIGETYFVPLDTFEGEEPDELQPDEGLEPYFGKNLIYCYSTTILPEFQKQGFGKILKAYLYGYAKAKGFAGSIAHAKEGPSIKLNTYFGAKIIGKFPDWYKTGITHLLYLKMF